MDQDRAKQQNSPPQRTIRTYIMDMKEKIQNEDISLQEVIAAEAQNQTNNQIYQIPQKEHIWQKKWLQYLLIIFFVVSLGTISGFFLLTKKTPIKKVEVSNDYLKNIFVSIEKIEKISFDTTPTKNDLIEAIRAKFTEIGDKYNSGLFAISLVKNKIEQQKKVEEKISAIDFFDILQVDMPSILRRNLSSEYFLGISLPEANPVLVLKINSPSYGTAFAGMIEWENTLLKDLASIIIKKTRDNPNSIPPIKASFEDKTFKSKDLRFVRNENGQIIFLYTIKDEKTIVITGGELSLEKVLNNFTK